MTSHISQVAFISPSEELEAGGSDGSAEMNNEGKDEEEPVASGDIPKPGVVEDCTGGTAWVCKIVGLYMGRRTDR
jgi:hypothetical protein